MKTVVEILIDDAGQRIGAITGLEHLRARLSETGKSYNIDVLAADVSYIARALCKHQSRFFSQGLHGLAPTTTAFIERDKPYLASVFDEQVSLMIHGEEIPATLFFQPSVDTAPTNSAPIARCETHRAIALLDALTRQPFANDSESAATLRADFPSTKTADIERIRIELGIPTALQRANPAAIMSEAVDRLGRTKWLRSCLRERIRFAVLVPVRPPWPSWWQGAMGASSSDALTLDFGDSTLHVRASALESARSHWAQHSPLIDGVDEAPLRNALAELVARRVPAEDIDDARRILLAFVRCGRWPEKRDPIIGPLHPTEIVEMLRTCPESEWGEVMPVVVNRGLTTKPDADEADAWVDTLALLLTESTN